MSSAPKYFYDFGPFRVDVEQRVLLRGGKPVALAPKAFEMLLALVENSGQVMGKDELLRKVWRDSFVEEANLSNNVFLLRRVLGEDKGGRKYIETVPRRGYRFVAEVTLAGDDCAERVIEEHTRAHIVIEEEHDEAAIANNLNSETLRATRSVAVLSRESRASNRRLTLGVVVASSVILCTLAAGALWLRLSRNEAKSSLPASAPSFSAARVAPLTTSPGDEVDPALSPDGKLLAFSAAETRGGGFHIYVKQIDAGGLPLRLTAEPVREAGDRTPAIRDGAPAWSPDGRYIAYVRGSPIREECGIFVIPSLGGVARRLHSLKDVNFAAGLDWAPDGKSLVIPLNTSLQDPFAIYSLAVETLELKRLTQPPSGYPGDSRPALSPDGRSVAFNRATNASVSELYVAPLSGGEPKRLTFDNRFTVGAAWTGDSTQIIFASNRAGSYSLWRVAVAGGAPQPLAAGAENALDPSVSPQANRLAYTQRLSDTNVWRLDFRTPAGPTPTRLISSTRQDANPHLSPDGKRIAFESDRTGNREIWLCDVDGSNALQLTALKGAAAAVNPRWSPDGTRIVFESRPEGLADTYVVSADGGEPRRLTNDPHNEVAPSWSADGRFIYFASDRGGDWQVWQMPSEGGEAMQVTSKGGFEAHESQDGQFLYYNKYGYNTRGLFRIPTTGGEEALILDIAQRESFGSWAVTNDGIYYIDRENFNHCGIEFFDFGTKRTTELASLDQDPSANPGLNVSRGPWFILSLLERSSHDIMLLENFVPAG